jgi:hypothetical protein
MRPRSIVALAVGAAAIAVLVRYTVFFDAHEYLDRQSKAFMDRALSADKPLANPTAALARFHRGQRPCLFDPPEFSEDQAKTIGAEISRAGLEDALSVLGYWIHDGERARHGEPTDEEIAVGLRLLDDTISNRALVALNRSKLVAAARRLRNEQNAKGREAEDKLLEKLPHERLEALRAVWERHEHELTFPGLLMISREVRPPSWNPNSASPDN